MLLGLPVIALWSGRMEPMPDTGTPRPNRRPFYDPESGVRVRPGRLTALVAEHPADAVAVVDRLGRYTPSDATWGGARLEDIALDQVRDRILVADHEADLFAGTLQDMVAPASRGAGLSRCAAPRGATGHNKPASPHHTTRHSEGRSTPPQPKTSSRPSPTGWTPP
ncbi:hypothetical protein [Streptomyces sp. NPDC006355]|uniref:hypothetical protein n=1 Tax=Streptomyces sp. NPDC006355 TaxID=3156758 RepID=UPI0033AB791E